MLTEQELALAKERDRFQSLGGDAPNTYLGKNFSGFQHVPNYKIAHQARTDAFSDIEKKGFAYAHATAHPASEWSDKFDHSQLWEYVQNYRQAVLGHYMAMAVE